MGAENGGGKPRKAGGDKAWLLKFFPHSEAKAWGILGGHVSSWSPFGAARPHGV